MNELVSTKQIKKMVIKQVLTLIGKDLENMTIKLVKRLFLISTVQIFN